MQPTVQNSPQYCPFQGSIWFSILKRLATKSDLLCITGHGGTKLYVLERKKVLNLYTFHEANFGPSFTKLEISIEDNCKNGGNWSVAENDEIIMKFQIVYIALCLHISPPVGESSREGLWVVRSPNAGIHPFSYNIFSVCDCRSPKNIILQLLFITE